MIMGYSNNRKAAPRLPALGPLRAGIRLASPQGYSDAATRMWEKDKVWDADPVLLPFRDIPRLGRRQMAYEEIAKVYV